MTICQIVTAIILATKMDKATGTMPAPAGKAVLAFICLFVAGMALTPLLLCAHRCCLYDIIVWCCCSLITLVCTLQLYAL